MAGDINSIQSVSSGGINQGDIHSSPHINAAADRVQEAGDVGFWRDGTDQMADAAAQEALALGTDAPQLVAEILDRDPGAGSWLNVNTLQARLDNGMITQREFNATVAAIASAYSDNQIGFHDMSDMLGLKDAAFFYDGGESRWPAEFKGALEAAAGDPALAPVIEQFRTDLAREIMDGTLPGIGPASQASAGHVALAIEILNDNGPTAVADMLATLPEESLDFVLRGASGTGLGNIYLDNAGFDNAGDILAIITDSITAAGNDELALSVVRFANGTGDGGFYQGVEAIPERAQLLTDLFVNHSDYILENLTLGSQTAGAQGDGTELGGNLSDLSNLLRLTAFNVDNPHQGAALQALETFTNDTVASYNALSTQGDLTHWEARQLDELGQQIVSVGASAQEAYRSAHRDNQAGIEAQRAMVSFVLDVALTAVPLTGRAKGAVAGEIAGLFADDSSLVAGAVERVLEDLSGDIIDTASGALTTEARNAIVEALGNDEAIVRELHLSAQNYLADTLLQAVTAPNELARDMYTTLDQIDNSR